MDTPIVWRTTANVVETLARAGFDEQSVRGILADFDDKRIARHSSQHIGLQLFDTLYCPERLADVSGTAE